MLIMGDAHELTLADLKRSHDEGDEGRRLQLAFIELVRKDRIAAEFSSLTDLKAKANCDAVQSSSFRLGCSRACFGACSSKLFKHCAMRENSSSSPISLASTPRPLAVGARRDAERSGLDRNAWRDLDDGRARERLVEVDDGNVMGAAIAGHEVTLAITATADGMNCGFGQHTKSRG
jgi:hypothetical protein